MDKDSENGRNITCVERVDRVRLQYILKYCDTYHLGKSFRHMKLIEGDAQKTLLKNYLYSLKRQDGNTGTRKVQYTQHHSLEGPMGRYWSDQFSLANMSRPIRHTICREFYYDIDIKNAHPIFLQWYCKKEGIKCDVLDEFIDNREEVYAEFISQEKELGNEMSRDEAKKAFLAVINGGGISSFKSELIKTFKVSLVAIQKDIKKKNEELFTYLSKKKERNILGSITNHIMMNIENRCLMAIYDMMKDFGIDVGSLVYDGLMIERKSTDDFLCEEKKDLDWLLKECEETIFQNVGVKVSVVEKVMDEGYDIPDDVLDDRFDNDIPFEDYIKAIQDHGHDLMSKRDEEWEKVQIDHEDSRPMQDNYLVDMEYPEMPEIELPDAPEVVEPEEPEYPKLVLPEKPQCIDDKDLEVLLNKKWEKECSKIKTENKRECSRLKKKYEEESKNYRKIIRDYERNVKHYQDSKAKYESLVEKYQKKKTRCDEMYEADTKRWRGKFERLEKKVLKKMNKEVCGELETFVEENILPDMNDYICVISGSAKAYILHRSVVYDPLSGKATCHWLSKTIKNFLETFIHYTVVSTIDVEGNQKLVSLVELWIKWIKRKQRVSEVFTRGLTNPMEFNTFTRLNIDKYDAQHADESKSEKVLQFLRSCWCRGNEEYFNYLLDWLAFCVQRPTEKNQVALVLIGNEGAGKGSVVQLLADILGRNYFSHPSSHNDILGDFNFLLDNKLLIYIDELTWGGNHKDDGCLKKLITENTRSSNCKMVPQRIVMNGFNVVISSNNEWVIPAGSSARRYFVLNVGNDMLEMSAEERDAIRHTNRKSFAKILFNRDISEFQIGQCPKTVGLEEQKKISMSQVDQFLIDCIENGGFLNNNDFDKLICKKELYERFKTEYSSRISNVQFWISVRKKILMEEKQCTVNGKRQRYVRFINGKDGVITSLNTAYCFNIFGNDDDEIIHDSEISKRKCLEFGRLM